MCWQGGGYLMLSTLGLSSPRKNWLLRSVRTTSLSTVNCTFRQKALCSSGVMESLARSRAHAPGGRPHHPRSPTGTAATGRLRTGGAVQGFPHINASQDPAPGRGGLTAAQGRPGPERPRRQAPWALLPLQRQWRAVSTWQRRESSESSRGCPSPAPRVVTALSRLTARSHRDSGSGDT